MPYIKLVSLFYPFIVSGYNNQLFPVTDGNINFIVLNIIFYRTEKFLY